VFSFRPRIAAFAGVLVLAMIGSTVSAQAIVPESHITTPGDPAYLFENNSPSATFTVAGTANVAEVEIRCYYAKGTEVNEAYKEVNKGTKEEKVIVTGGVFSVSEPLHTLPSQPCVLRAVPAGDKGEHPPGSADALSGPRVIRSFFEIFTKSSVAYNYEQEFTTLGANLGVDSVGHEGLYYSFLFAPGSLVESESGFYNNASLQTENQPPSASATRSELQVDGTNAYAPDGAEQIGEKLVKGLLPGTPSVAASTTETAPGEFVVHESDPIVKCSGKAPVVFPPTKESCESFVSTGVQLNRTWQSTHGDRVALMTDSWASTDGHAHALDALYDQEPSQNGEGAFEFPGSSSFTTVNKGQTQALPGDSAIYYKTNAATPDGGDLTNPQLAIVYDSAPDGSVAFHKGSKTETRPDFEMHYARTIPAGGSYTLRMGFVTEYALDAVKALAGEILATYPPHVSIASPANGTAVSTPTVTLTGSASDAVAVSSVAVNGHAATLASNGSWSVSVPLNLGANTLTAVATDQAGLTASQSIAVAYVPTQAVQVGNASGANGKVRFKVACKGLAGQTCKIVARLTTKEKLRGSRLLAITAKHHKRPKTRSKIVTVGSRTVTIPAGKTVTITINLNATGRKLLARYHKLPVHLSAVFVAGATKSTVIAQNLTVKPKPKKKHKHHKGRH
jgi:Glucodextranase, domain B